MKMSMSETKERGEVNHQGNPGADESGAWEATEEYMMKHDSGMVKDFADDVDTLLVFAGLFSAVLTAFVVESYHLLQVDNVETAAKLLARISLQLESFTFYQGYLNSTTSSLPPTPPFQPDHSALWINVLWFLSLVFSLSAALFGILVKQWLREYLRWSSALASPRDNVLVRQVRFEAWNEWNMAATIACIPALLEVALIFFVCGLVVLLWTLDPFVAIVITVAVAVFLLIISSFTLLPAFFKHCPYKSPTAWACVLIWELGRDTACYAVNRWRLYRSAAAVSSEQLRWKLKHWHTSTANWRARDIASASISGLTDWRGKGRDPHTLAQKEIAAEWIDLDEEGELHEDFDPSEIALDAVHQTLAPISQAPILFRALSWVTQASQDSRVQQQVLHCTRSLYPTSLAAYGIDSEPSSVLHGSGTRNISVWHLLFTRCKQQGPEGLPVDTRDHPRLVFVLRSTIRGLYNTTPHTSSDSGRYQIIRYGLDWHTIQRCRWLFSDYSPRDVQIMAHILAGHFKATIEELLEEWDEESYGSYLMHGRRAVELLAALQGLLYHSYPTEAATCVTTLLEAYNAISASSEKGIFDCNFPGLRCIILEVACWMAVIDMDDKGALVAHSIGFWKTTALDFAELAIKLKPSGGSRADQHIFVTITDACLWRLEHGESLPAYIGDALLHVMCTATNTALEARVPNCGYYDDLPWLANLLSATLAQNSLARACSGRFKELVALLEKSVDAGLVTGVGAKACVQELRMECSGGNRMGLRRHTLGARIPDDSSAVYRSHLEKSNSQASWRQPPVRRSIPRRTGTPLRSNSKAISSNLSLQHAIDTPGPMSAVVGMPLRNNSKPGTSDPPVRPLSDPLRYSGPVSASVQFLPELHFRPTSLGDQVEFSERLPSEAPAPEMAPKPT